MIYKKYSDFAHIIEVPIIPRTLGARKMYFLFQAIGT
jgi:hypothetical protein